MTCEQPILFYCLCVCLRCDSGGDCECLCTAIAAYAEECNRRGVYIRWRSQELCRMSDTQDAHTRPHSHSQSCAHAPLLLFHCLSVTFVFCPGLAVFLLFFCPSVHPILVNMISEQHFEEISSNLAQTSIWTQNIF